MKNFILFISAIILGGIIIPIGFVYTICKYVFRLFFDFLKYLFYILKQISKVIKYLFTKSKHPILLKLAIAIDLFGNVTSGEMIEDFVTKEKNTLFSNGDYTISAAVGRLEIDEKLNKKGVWFSKTLSKIFERNHSIKAYLSTINN